MSIKTERVNALSTLIYETENGVTRLCRCVPYKGVRLYEIKATYAKTVRASSYYILAKTLREAKRRFRSTFTWLDVVGVRLISGEEAESILTNPLKMPL